MKDLRKARVLPDKAFAEALGATAGVSTTTGPGSPIPCVDMSVTLNMSQDGYAQITFMLTGSGGTLGFLTLIYVDGIPITPTTGTYNNYSAVSGTTGENTITSTLIVPLAKGAHKIDGYWAVNAAGSVSASAYRRTLIAREL